MDRKVALFLLVFGLVACEGRRPTEQATPSPDARRHVAAALEPMREYRDALQRLDELSSRADQDPQRMLSDAWRRDAAQALTRLRAAGRQLGALNASTVETRPLDDLLQRIADETGPMVTEYTEGIEWMDRGKTMSASARLHRIRGWLDEAEANLAR
jgi:hypothetical protein